MNRDEYLVEFKKLTDAMLKITEAKNNDYAGASGEDPFKNFKNVENFGMTTEQGFICRMTDKLTRISNLTKQEAAVSDESIEDTLLDLANYSLLFRLYLTSKEDERIPDFMRGFGFGSEGLEGPVREQGGVGVK